MAAQFTEVSLEDMEKFLKRGFRSLRPTRSQQYNEYYYDLKLGPFVGIRVWSSVKVHSGQGAEVGADAIRVQLVSLKDSRPLEKGKAPIVKRTQGWRNSLQDRIEDCIEKYENNDSFWEGWAETRQMNRAQPPAQREVPRQEAPLSKQDEYERDNAETEGDEEMRREYEDRDPTPPPRRNGPPATPKQVGYALVLLRNVTQNHWHEMLAPKMNHTLKNFKDHIPSKNELEGMTISEVSTLIDLLKTFPASGGGGYRRYAAEAEYEIGVGEYDYGR